MTAACGSLERSILLRGKPLIIVEGEMARTCFWCLGVAAAACVLPLATAQPDDVSWWSVGNVEYWWSENGACGVRVVPADGHNATARVNVLKYAPDKRTYESVCTLKLPYRVLPRHMVVTNDGRYVLALRRCASRSNDGLPDAVWIADTQTRVTKSFALTEFLSDEQVRRHALWTPMIAGVVWFEDHRSELRPVVNQAAGKVFVTLAIDETDAQSQQAGDKTEDRIVPSFERPTVVIDVRAMTVTTVDSKHASFWKAQHDRRALRADLLTKLMQTCFPQERESGVLQFVDEAVGTPVVEHRYIGTDLLFRLAPANGNRPAEVVSMKIRKDGLGFEHVRTIKLVNPLSPSNWLIVPSGRYLVTFDEKGRIGATRNAIVIYEVETDRRKSFRLEDFLTQEVLERIATVGNLRVWRLGLERVTIAEGTEYRGVIPRQTSGAVSTQWHVFPEIVIDVERKQVRQVNSQTRFPVSRDEQ